MRIDDGMCLYLGGSGLELLAFLLSIDVTLLPGLFV